MDNAMKVGDLVIDRDESEFFPVPEPGLVLAIDTRVEIPPLIEVLWGGSGHISKVYQDELKVLCKSSSNVVE
jgi:hypothetical protein